MYFDSHAHYDDGKFKNDQKSLLSNLSVAGIINVGACIKSSKLSINLAEEYPYIHASVGVHPHYAKSVTDKDLDTLKVLCEHEKVVAIGETGLDFHYDNSPRDVQRRVFAQQLELAKAADMPVIVHSRDAAAETMAIIKESGVRKGVLHCYSGHLPMALEYIEMGYYISLAGVVTYNNAVKTREVAANIPLERLLIETDAPYLAPVPFRGKRCDSSMLSFVAEAIAEVRRITAEEVAEVTAENAKRLFGIE